MTWFRTTSRRAAAPIHLLPVIVPLPLPLQPLVPSVGATAQVLSMTSSARHGIDNHAMRGGQGSLALPCGLTHKRGQCTGTAYGHRLRRLHLLVMPHEVASWMRWRVQD